MRRTNLIPLLGCTQSKKSEFRRYDTLKQKCQSLGRYDEKKQIPYCLCVEVGIQAL